MSDEHEISVSARIQRLPPYLFGRLNKMKHAKRQANIDIIDLGMGNPSDAPMPEVVAKLAEAAADPRNSRYTTDGRGVANLRREVAKKYQRRWGVALDPEKEVICTIGSKEGLSHMCLALLGPGDTVVVGDPAYPIHIYAVALAGANVVRIPLGNDQDYLKRIAYVAEHLYPRPKLVIFNYPHNPSALTIEAGFWDEVVSMAKHYGFMVISDFAYGETCFDGYQAPSFLAAKDAKKVGVEFTTTSKPYNMAGWRVGFCAGNPRMVEALGTIKGYYDYGLFQAIQVASIIALRQGDEFIKKQAEIYQKRRDVLISGLNRIGWKTESPRASMFVWTRVADEHLAGKGTIDFALRMMEEAEVAVAPGRAFGEYGEGYLRIALVENELRLKQALRQIECMVKNKPLRKPARKADRPAAAAGGADGRPSPQPAG